LNNQASLQTLLIKARKFHNDSSFKEAITLYNLILSKVNHSQNPGVLLLAGQAYYEIKDYETALSYVNKSLKFLNNADTYNTLSQILVKLKRYSEAEESLKIAIKIDPNNPILCNSLGVVYSKLKQEKLAQEYYRKGIKINPKLEVLYFNLAKSHTRRKEYKFAINFYNKVIEINPDFYDAYWNKSLVLLKLGNFEEGWELYNFRKLAPYVKNLVGNLEEVKWRKFDQLSGKSLLIRAEQGFGDSIQFIRFLFLFQYSNCHITFQVQPQLIPLFKNINFNCDVDLISLSNTPKEYDYRCYLLTLPSLFKTSIQDLPIKENYICPDSQKRLTWFSKIKSKKMNIGFAISGSQTKRNSETRDISYLNFQDCMSSKFNWHSLHKEYKESDFQFMEFKKNIFNHQDLLTDFSETAALIDSLDLVITVDTAVAHLAGALGVETWVMLEFNNDFRWLEEKDFSPWYQSIKLYRQTTSGSWDNVIREIKGDLERI